jgi:hypothetical protein
LANSTKVIVISSDSEQLSVIDTLTNSKHRQPRLPFNYVSFSSRREKKTFNIFECSECISDPFLSERNLIIITFNEKTLIDDKLKESLVRRVLNVLTKNIIPSKILLLGLVQTGADSKALISKIQQHINEVVSSYVASLKSKIFLRKDENLPFQTQKLIANQINLLEQLQILQSNMTTACLDINSKKGLLIYSESSLIDDYAADIKALQEATKALEEGRMAISNITRIDLSEIKSYGYPPKSVLQVTECACLIFGMKPSYEFFKRLLSQNDLIKTIQNYDPDSMSDYAFKELKKYIDNPEFTPEICNGYSKFAGNFCLWVRGIYKWNAIQRKIEPIKDKLINITTLSNVDVILIFLFCKIFNFFFFKIKFPLRVPRISQP